jgi:high-affinity nickel-transport protein
MSAIAAPETTLGVGLIVTAFVFGLRHGVDWDHIAAITDITGSQQRKRDSLLFSTLYALGHASVVLLLGIAAIAGGRFIPEGFDSIMEPVVGGTLVLLGIYLFWGLLRHGPDVRMRSRWMLLIEGIRRVHHRISTRGKTIIVEHEHEHDHVDPGAHDHLHDSIIEEPLGVQAAPATVLTATHKHPHRHTAPLPQDPFMNYGRASSLMIGMLHGVGAETPSQLLIFIAAAGVGGTGAGVLLLVSFLAGLLTSNTAMALASTYGFAKAERSKKIYVGVALVTASFSLVLGTMYLLGRGELLPHLL